MIEERAVWQDQKRKKEFEVQRAEAQIKELINGIRVDLNPFAPIDQIQEDLVYDQAIRLRDAFALYRGAQKSLANLKDALGIS